MRNSLKIIIISFQFISLQALALTCADLDGAYVVAHDDTYLGFFGSQFASDSINNQFGTYGNEFALNSESPLVC